MTATTTPTTATTRHLAEFLTGTEYVDLPADVIEHCYRATIDWLGSAVAGAFEPPARLAQQVIRGLGTSQESTVFGDGRASAAAAALANGVASHILELDDVHKGSTLHGGAPVISAALAVAEREHAPGTAFMRAVALGYDAALRIGEAVNPSHYRFWHPTGTAATFGAAAAAGSLLGLTTQQMIDALGTAGTQAAGLWEFNVDGAMSKHLHPGKAAFNGVLAADLARVGFTGATRILEGDRGFFRATSTSHDPTRVTDRLGERWTIAENCYKLHSCCAHTHTAIDVALDIRRRQAWTGSEVLERVERVEIDTYASGYAIVSDANPTTPYRGKFSLAYCVAAALLEGKVGLEQFSPERFSSDGVTDPAISAMLPRIHVSVSDDLSRQYPAKWPARVAVTVRDGSKEVGASEYPRGNPEHPVSTEMLEQKFLDLASRRYAGPMVQRALDVVRRIDDCEDIHAEFAELFR